MSYGDKKVGYQAYAWSFPSETVEALHKWWALATGLCGYAGVKEELFNDIINSYSAPGRFYHNAEHLLAALEATKTLTEGRLKSSDCGRLYLALFYHDFVYDPQEHDNETESVLAMWDHFPFNRSSDAVKCARVILATRPDAKPIGDIECIARDADQAVLASSPEDYQKYVDAVRKEYGFVTNTAWYAGRTRVLRGLLDQDRIFTFRHESNEAQARENIEREIYELEYK